MLYETGETATNSACRWSPLISRLVIFILMAYRGYIGYRSSGNSALFNVVYRDGKLMNVNIKRLSQS